MTGAPAGSSGPQPSAIGGTPWPSPRLLAELPPAELPPAELPTMEAAVEEGHVRPAPIGPVVRRRAIIVIGRICRVIGIGIGRTPIGDLQLNFLASGRHALRVGDIIAPLQGAA